MVEFASVPKGRKSLKDEEAAKIRLCGGGDQQYEDDEAMAVVGEAPAELVASVATRPREAANVLVRPRP